MGHSGERMKGWYPSESTAQFSFGCGARRRWKRGVQKGTGVEAGHFGRDGMKGEDIPTVHTHREKAFLGGLKAWSAQRSDDQSTIYCCNSKGKGVALSHRLLGRVKALKGRIHTHARVVSVT